MSARTKSRKRALDVLYAAESRDLPPQMILDERKLSPDLTALGDYAETLIRGVYDNRHRIDRLIIEHAEGWTLERMPAVDRAILRIAVYELIWSTDVPPAVAVNEAVEAAKVLSTDNSPRFVNGVLGQIAAITPALRGA